MSSREIVGYLFIKYYNLNVKPWNSDLFIYLFSKKLVSATGLVTLSSVMAMESLWSIQNR